MTVNEAQLPRIKQGVRPDSGHPEARYHGGIVSVFEKFADLPSRSAKRHVLLHELGHWYRDQFLELSDIAAWSPEDPFFKTYGTPNFEEAFAESFAAFHTDPGHLKSNHPAEYAFISSRVTASDKRRHIQWAEGVLDQTLDEDLRDWFREKWVDISRTNDDGSHPPCGRSGEKSGGYPKCVPLAKARAMSDMEKKSAVARKRRSGQPEDGKPTNVATDKDESVSEGENEPTNPALWARAVTKAREKFDVYPSAYANGWAAKWYKEQGGGWRTKGESIEEATARAEYKASLAMRNRESDLAARFGLESGLYAEATDEQRVEVVQKLLAYTGHAARVNKSNFNEMARRAVADYVENGMLSENIRTMGLALRYLDRFKVDYGKDSIPLYAKQALQLA